MDRNDGVKIPEACSGAARADLIQAGEVERQNDDGMDDLL